MLRCPLEVEWETPLASPQLEQVSAVHQLADGGYIVGGAGVGAWAARLDAQGSVLWQKRYSSTSGETMFDLQPTADGGFIPALATKTQLLYGMKRFNEAYELSKGLIAKLPKDPGLLFYHAKISHEAHAYKAEIEALEKLIAWADREGRPAGGYRLYLGQAYAATGDGRRSIDSFQLALDDPNLPPDQRAFARENIERIKERTGL